MKQSKLFTKTRKEAPKDEVSKNAELLIRAGYIYKEMAGVYAFLPLGVRVINKIQNIIREEMNMVGGQELSMTALQDKQVWEKSGRWNDEVLDVWFKTQLKNGGEIGLGTTHEEPITAMMKNYVNSFRDLPAYVYQFQTKFRNETRAKSGIIRGREFLMKDLYSFSKTQEEHDAFYEEMQNAYSNIYSRVGLGNLTYKTFALGGSFSKFSHEYQTICDAGEDLIYVDEEKKIAINKEAMLPEIFAELGLDKEKLVEKKAVEVGNIFTLGKRFSEPFDLAYKNETGNEELVIMGSYGIGLGRLMGTVVEVLSDDKGIVWPESIAPFMIHLISLGADEKVQGEAERIYNLFKDKNIEVLWDDRDLRPGEKFADSDLIGIPTRIVISSKTIEAGKFEVKGRTDTEASMMTEEELLAKVA